MNVGRNEGVNETEPSSREPPAARSAVQPACQRLPSGAAATHRQAKTPKTPRENRGGGEEKP